MKHFCIQHLELEDPTLCDFTLNESLLHYIPANQPMEEFAKEARDPRQCFVYSDAP